MNQAVDIATLISQVCSQASEHSLTVVDTTQHVVCNLISSDQMLLNYSAISLLVDLFDEKALIVGEILLPANASFENTGSATMWSYRYT